MSSLVGIFFVIENFILCDSVPLEQAEVYGDFLQHGGHYAFWENFIPKSPVETSFKHRAYDYSPRGRVVYHRPKSRFILYADRCISAQQIKDVALRFDLGEFRKARDEHYLCAGCNRDFLDLLGDE